jgi:hypothetical protein
LGISIPGEVSRRTLHPWSVQSNVRPRSRWLCTREARASTADRHLARRTSAQFGLRRGTYGNLGEEYTSTTFAFGAVRVAEGIKWNLSSRHNPLPKDLRMHEPLRFKSSTCPDATWRPLPLRDYLAFTFARPPLEVATDPWSALVDGAPRSRLAIDSESDALAAHHTKICAIADKVDDLVRALTQPLVVVTGDPHISFQPGEAARCTLLAVRRQHRRRAARLRTRFAIQNDCASSHDSAFARGLVSPRRGTPFGQ